MSKYLLPITQNSNFWCHGLVFTLRWPRNKKSFKLDSLAHAIHNIFQKAILRHVIDKLHVLYAITTYYLNILFILIWIKSYFSKTRGNAYEVYV